jgi:hypothetical protein
MPLPATHPLVSAIRGTGRRALVVLILALIGAYRVCVRPLFGGSCKFHPNCSEYAAEAVWLHGPFRGLLLTVRRLFRCRPFSMGGYDPVPGPPRTTDSSPAVPVE